VAACLAAACLLAVSLTAVSLMAVSLTAAAADGRRTGGESQSRLPPPARAVLEPSLAAFLAELKTIVRQRDAAALLPRVAEDPGVEPGAREAFGVRWRIRDPKSQFWHDLEWLLTLDGDSIGPGTYCLPYAASRFPDEQRDGLHGLIVRANASVRAEPSSTAAVIASLSYAIVERDLTFERPYDRSPDSYGEYGAPWIKILLPGGARGYVAREDYWPALGPELCLSQLAGRWRIASFEYGD
jgi:hypothetical protein